MSEHFADYEPTRQRILELKRSVNPRTGKLYTMRQIGKIIGMSAPGVYWYLKDDKGVCPSCRQPLYSHNESSSPTAAGGECGAERKR